MPAFRLRQMHGLLATLAAAILLLLSLSFPFPAQAEDPAPLRGVALVIGQSKYAKLPQLPNAGNDADAIEELLSDLGFDSVRRTDRDAPALLRDLERFVEDAEGADVAVLYYSGHGIEAGGENWLVPVDADLSALDDAGATLVPVSATLEKLKATVPVAIVMLDACRDNPFPPGSLLRPAPGGEPVAVGAAGLGESGGGLSRSAVGLTESTQEQASLPGINVGTVIAFAAEPGKVALDGDAGGNSPYASAVLRHFDAMTGEEFGMVMRMVAEEVYLRTGGRQYPWINENLRRLLYFGRQPAGPEGEEGEILRERRGLLVTISELPDASRRQVERIAASDGVPMDALYAMLKVLGQDAPSDPAQLEDILRRQTEHIRKLVAERATLDGLDPQIERLSALSRQAVDEGALDTAKRLRQQITERAAEVDSFLSDQESNILQRRIELAAVHAESAEISNIALDNLAAARYYRLAYDQVRDRDAKLSIDYMTGEFNALLRHGIFRSDAAAIEDALPQGVEAFRLAESHRDIERMGKIQNNLATALLMLGRAEEARGIYQAMLKIVSRDEFPSIWADLQRGLGTSLHVIGQNDQDPEKFHQAQEAFSLASEAYLETGNRVEWITTRLIVGQALLSIGTRENRREPFDEALDILRSTLDGIKRSELPLEWATAWFTVGNVLVASGRQSGEIESFREAAQAYRTAYEEIDRERVPALWSSARSSLGDALLELGTREKDIGSMFDAVETYREALEILQPATSPREWAARQDNIASAQIELGLMLRQSSHIQAAKEAISAAWNVDAANDYPYASEDYYRERLRAADEALGEVF